MTAPQTLRTHATWNSNHLRRGATYSVTTRKGIVVGEYLGRETPYGDPAMLVRHEAGTESIEFCDVISICPATV